MNLPLQSNVVAPMSDEQLLPAVAPHPLAILQRAVEQGVSPEHLDKLLSLQERYEASQAAGEFARALAAFQAEMPPVAKSRVVLNKDMASTRYKFAGFEDIMVVAQPILARHGIAVMFTQSVDEKVNGAGEVTGTNLVMTMRVRVGRHHEDKTVSAPLPNVPRIAQDMRMNEPQAFGLVVSYFKRYCLCAGLNIVVADEDSDAAFGISAAEAVRLCGLMAKCREAGKPVDVPRWLAWLGAESIETIRRADFDKAVADLTHKLREAEGGKK